MQASGTCFDWEIQDILLRMSSRRASGAMIAQSEAEVLTVFFQKGEIVAADLNEAFSTGLGAVLVQQASLSKEQLDELSTQQLRATAEFSSFLLKGDLVSVGQLLAGEREYVYRLIVRMLRWSTGDFKFYEAEALGEDTTFPPLSVEEVLVRVSVEDSELGGSPPPELGSQTYRTGVAADGATGEGFPAGFLPTRLEERLLKLADGSRPSSEYVSELSSDEFRVRFALRRLLASNIVQPGAPISVDPIESLEPAEPVSSDPGPAPLSQPGREEVPFASTELDRLLEATAPRAPTYSELLEVPEETIEESPKLGLSELRQLFRGVSRGWSAVLALTLAAVLLGTVLVSGDARYLLLPLPWQTAGRVELERRQREASYERIERAVTTGFLMNGTVPRELTQLVDENLLRAGDLYDSAGHWLVYGTSEDGFPLEPSEAGENLVGEQGSFSFRRDFLLADDFLKKPFPSDRPPLALLD